MKKWSLFLSHHWLVPVAQILSTPKHASPATPPWFVLTTTLSGKFLHVALTMFEYEVDDPLEPYEHELHSGFSSQFGDEIDENPNRYNGGATLPTLRYPAPVYPVGPGPRTSRGHPYGHGHPPLAPISSAYNLLVELTSHLMFPDTYHCSSRPSVSQAASF